MNQQLQYLKYNLFFTIFIIAILTIQCSDTENIDSEIIIEETIEFDNYEFPVDSFEVFNGQVKKNETLAEILVNAGVEYTLATKIYNESKPMFDFRKIQPSKNYAVYKEFDSLSSFHGFVYEINKFSFLRVENHDSLIIELKERNIDIRIKNISGIINSSLYETLIEKNASIVIAGKIAEVFAWQIDFYTIQKGDKFYAVYEEQYIDGEPVGVGDILVAKFIHKNNTFNAYQFDSENRKEYFDEAGGSLQKEFLKAPLKYKRISSRYSGSRFHPILRVYRPHRGIDYAAAVGTPVQSVGDGVVIMVGRNGAAGKMVKIRHNSVYTSAYLHLSRYGKGIKRGAKVMQGQVIGYVGSTGRSTGPHLDFRFWKNGSLVNYLTQKFPASKSVADSNMNSFFTVRDSLNSMLDSLLTQ